MSDSTDELAVSRVRSRKRMAEEDALPDIGWDVGYATGFRPVVGTRLLGPSVGLFRASPDRILDNGMMFSCVIESMQGLSLMSRFRLKISPHKLHFLRLLHLQRNRKGRRVSEHLIQHRICLVLTSLEDRSDLMLQQQLRQDSNEFNLREFLTRTDARSFRPRGEGA